MNKILSVLLSVVVAVGIVPYAHSVGSPTPPPGISAENWVPMGEAAGFVLTGTGNGNNFRQGLRSEPTVAMKGYFMIRLKGAWWRAETAPDYETHPVAFDH